MEVVELRNGGIMIAGSPFLFLGLSLSVAAPSMEGQCPKIFNGFRKEQAR